VKFCCVGKCSSAIPGRWFWLAETIKLVWYRVFSEADFGEFEQRFFGRAAQMIRGRFSVGDLRVLDLVR
jgi:hypothetical protein